MKSVVKKNIKSILLVCFLLIVSNILSAVHPYVVKQVLDVDFASKDIEKIILKLIAVYITIHTVLVLIKNIRDIAINKTICTIIKQIREKVFNKVLNFKMATFNKYSSSELYTRLTDDVDNLFDLFFGIVYQVISNVLRVIFMVIMMFIANINLVLIGFVTILVITFTVAKSARILGNINNEILNKRDIENKEFSELYNKNKLTYLFKLQKQNTKKIDNLFNAELKLRKKYIFVHHFPYWIFALLQAIGIYAIMYYALNIETAISLGSIYLVVFYMKECRSPLEAIFNKMEELQTCINSYKRIKILLQEKEHEDIKQGEYIENLNGDIEFQNVSMKYDKELVLKDMSFIIKQGTKVTIVGRTGVRKNYTYKWTYEII